MGTKIRPAPLSGEPAESFGYQMDSTFSVKLQAVGDGPLFRQFSEVLWLDQGKDLTQGHLPGVRVTHFDARHAEDKHSWRTPVLPDLRSATLIALLGWGAGRGPSALPRFSQDEVVKRLDSIRYDDDAHALLLSLTSKHLMAWLAFIGEHRDPAAEVWTFGPGKPVRLTWADTAHG